MPKTFKPGNKVLQSGIYTVAHDGLHTRRSHDVTCIAGSKFPPCNRCGKGVTFELKMAAVHVKTHQRFRKRKPKDWRKKTEGALSGAKAR
jgi:hypothetical protein